jgi:outer membrane murein-binding lipoprotein Lpp
MNDNPDVSRTAIFGLVGVAVAVAIIAVITVTGRDQRAPTTVAEAKVEQVATAPEDNRSAAIEAEIERLRQERDAAEREAAEARARFESARTSNARVERQRQAPQNLLAGEWTTWSSWTEVQAVVVFSANGRMSMTTPGYAGASADWSVAGNRVTIRFDHGPIYYATLSGDQLAGDAHPDSSSGATGTFRWTRQTS